MKKTKTIPAGEDVAKDPSLEVISIDRVSFEETLRYAEIPEFLSEIKQKISVAKKPQNQEQKQHEDKPVDKIDNEIEMTAQQSINKLLSGFFESREQLKRVKKQQMHNVRVVPEQEVIQCLQLAEDLDSDYVKVELQIKDKTYVVVIQVNKAMNYR